MSLKKQGRKKNPVWFHFIEDPLLNSSHYKAKCKYCSRKMGEVPANMLKHLKEECPNISDEIHNTLHNLDHDKTKNKNKNKRSHVETADSNDGN
jgi:hypothetical protein